MLVLGITGGPATGKSLVTRRLCALGAVTFSADEAARAVLNPDLLKRIASAFGPEVLSPEGNLERAALGRQVFANPNARRKLERILHPPILRLLRAQIDACQDDLPASTIVAVEVPLLFEAHLENWFERIVVVTASESLQIDRLSSRNGLDADEARRLLASQWPLAAKQERAHEVISNNSTVDDLILAIDALWKSLKSE